MRLGRGVGSGRGSTSRCHTWEQEGRGRRGGRNGAGPISGGRGCNQRYGPHRVMGPTASGEGGTETGLAFADAAHSVRVGGLPIPGSVPKEEFSC